MEKHATKVKQYVFPFLIISKVNQNPKHNFFLSNLAALQYSQEKKSNA